MGLRRRGIKLILWVPVAGIHECRVGAMSSKGCHGNGHTLMKGRGQVMWEVDTRGGGYSEDHTIQVDLVLAQITEIGVAQAVLCEAECRPWYREEGVQRWFLGRSVGSRGVAGRGSAATGPTGAPG